MAKQQVALVTGASRGIGLAIAARLAKEGYSLALIAKDGQALERAASQIRTSSSTPVRCYPLDLEQQEAIPVCIDEVLSDCGNVDLVVNNAGINVPGTLEASNADLQRCFTVNVAAPRAIVKALQFQFETRGAGQIVNISSISGLVGFAGNGVYGCTKRALLGLNESLFNELIPKGIKVTAICPSWVDTDMASYAGFPGSLMIQPSDIAETVVYLTRLSTQACVREIRVDCRHTI